MSGSRLWLHLRSPPGFQRFPAARRAATTIRFLRLLLRPWDVGLHPLPAALCLLPSKKLTGRANFARPVHTLPTRVTGSTSWTDRWTAQRTVRRPEGPEARASAGSSWRTSYGGRGYEDA